MLDVRGAGGEAIDPMLYFWDERMAASGSPPTTFWSGVPVRDRDRPGRPLRLIGHQGGWPRCLVAKGPPDLDPAVVRSPQQLVRDLLVTVAVLTQHRKLAMGKDAIHIRGRPGRTCPLQLTAELRQGHPLHRLLHDRDRSFKIGSQSGCPAPDE